MFKDRTSASLVYFTLLFGGGGTGGFWLCGVGSLVMYGYTQRRTSEGCDKIPVQDWYSMVFPVMDSSWPCWSRWSSWRCLSRCTSRQSHESQQPTARHPKATVIKARHPIWWLYAVLRIRIRIRIHLFFSLLDPIRGMDPDPDPSITKQK